jgi:hypothetical protein
MLISSADNIQNYAKLVDLLSRIDEPLRRMDDGLKNIHDELQGKETYELIG